MAVRIIEGVPGAGKTYFAVHHFLHSYYRFDETLIKWVPKKDVGDDLVLVSNIDSFDFALSLPDLIQEAGGLEKFFTYEFQSGFHAGKKVVYIIDEAQGLFPYKLYSPQVFLYFQKHRHLGHDVYLITQDADHLAKGLRTLAEFHVQAVRRSLSLTGEFRYRFVDPVTKDVWKTKVLRRDGRVFNFYRSMTGEESEKISSAPLKFFGLTVLLACLAVGWLFYWLFFGLTFGTERKAHAGSGGVSKGVTSSASKSSGVVAAPSKSHKVLPSGAIAPVRGQNASNPVTPSTKNSPGVSPLFPERVGRLSGVFSSGRGRLFVVEVGGRVFRVSEDVLTGLCGCHADLLVPGAAFIVSETFERVFIGPAPARAQERVLRTGRQAGGLAGEGESELLDGEVGVTVE